MPEKKQKKSILEIMPQFKYYDEEDMIIVEIKYEDIK